MHEIILIGGPRSSEIIGVKELSPYINFSISPKISTYNYPSDITSEKFRIIRYERRPGYKVSGYQVYRYVN